jgi:hypothetical protein
VGGRELLDRFLIARACVVVVLHAVR